MEKYYLIIKAGDVILLDGERKFRSEESLKKALAPLKIKKRKRLPNGAFSSIREATMFGGSGKMSVQWIKKS